MPEVGDAVIRTKGLHAGRISRVVAITNYGLRVRRNGKESEWQDRNVRVIKHPEVMTWLRIYHAADTRERAVLRNAFAARARARKTAADAMMKLVELDRAIAVVFS